MLARIGSFFLVLSLLANVVMGCANMTDRSGSPNLVNASVSKSASNNAMENGAMAGCDMAVVKTKGPAKQHGNSSSFCKSFCATLIATNSPNQISARIFDVPNQQLVARASSWDSSVDPPHPRSFDVMI
jgi:hypothetical protein